MNATKGFSMGLRFQKWVSQIIFAVRIFTFAQIIKRETSRLCVKVSNQVTHLLGKQSE